MPLRSLKEIVVKAFIFSFAVLLLPSAAAQSARNYEYDALGRLTKVTAETGSTVTYFHDLADNRTSVAAAGPGGPPLPTAVDDVYYIETCWWWYGTPFDFPAADNDIPPSGQEIHITAVAPNTSISIGSSPYFPRGLIVYSGPAISPGLYPIPYTITATGGGTANATLMVEAFTSGDC